MHCLEQRDIRFKYILYHSKQISVFFTCLFQIVPSLVDSMHSLCIPFPVSILSSTLLESHHILRWTFSDFTCYIILVLKAIFLCLFVSASLSSSSERGMLRVTDAIHSLKCILKYLMDSTFILISHLKIQWPDADPFPCKYGTKA